MLTLRKYDMLDAIRNAGKKRLVLPATGDGSSYGLVTALPTGTISVGSTCTYKADATNGIFWDLVYDGVGTYPWKCNGPAPLFAVENAEVKTKAATYQTTKSPSINYPLSGDYYVTWGCASVRAGIAGDTGFIRVGYHANGSLVREAIVRLDANGAEPAHRKDRHNERTKGQAANARYKNDAEAAGETTFEGLFIEIQPIRVG